MPKNIYLKLKDNEDADLISLMEKSSLTFPQFFKTLTRIALVNNMDEIKKSGIFPLDVGDVKSSYTEEYSKNTVNNSKSTAKSSTDNKDSTNSTAKDSKDTANNSTDTAKDSKNEPDMLSGLTQQIMSKNN